MPKRGGKPPEDAPKDAQNAPKGEQAGTDLSDISFQRLGQKIADLSRELSDITKLAGTAASRRHSPIPTHSNPAATSQSRQAKSCRRIR